MTRRTWKLWRVAAPRTVVCLLAAGLLTATPSAAQEGDPVAVVDALHETLLDMMKNADALGYAGRYERIYPVMLETYDTGFMGRKTVGRHWKKLDDDQKRKWLDTFRRLTAATYAGRFNGWSGQSFETHGSEPAASDTMIVRTVLRNPEDEDVELNYRMRSTKDGWRIIDIYLEGTVSELALRRSEYSSVLKNDGFEALIDSVNAKIADYESGKAVD